MKLTLLNTFVITPEGLLKKVQGHNSFALNYLKTINFNFDKLTEDDITEKMKLKVFELGFIRLSEFKNSFAIETFKPLNLKQLNCIIENIPLKENYVIEEHYPIERNKIFIEKKDFEDYLFQLIET